MTSALQPESDTARWYEDKVRTYGYDHRGLGFRTRSSQEKRFEALLTLGDLDGRSVLDVGCGFGDFLEFLQSRGMRTRYTGLDICAPMVRRCRERFGAKEGSFVVADVLDFEPGEEYDYVIASGIFGLDAADVRERIRPTLERMLAWSRLGAAANFLSQRAPTHAEGRVYVEPADLLEIGFALTPAVRLDHTYLPNDFTLYLFKTPAWERSPAGGTP